MIEGYIDSYEPLINENGQFIGIIVIGSKIKITTEELLQKISKFRHYYYEGKIKIIIKEEQKDFVEELIKKITMINLSFEIEKTL